MTRAAALLLLGLAACGTPPAPVPDAGAWWEPALRGCVGQAGPAPRTVGQVIARINALPKPVSVACVIADLPRPLTAVATTSTFSAQPADGRTSPRVFLLTDRLILSIVPAGAGSDLLEMGELFEPGRTLKAELRFPVTAPLPMDAAFTRVQSGPYQTSCGLCHRAETMHPTVDAGFVSAAFRPNPGELVPIAELKAELDKCDPAADRPRCLLLTALMGLGPVAQGKFPSGFELFVQ